MISLKGVCDMEKSEAIYEYRVKRIMLIYLFSSAFCLLIFLVYNIFSHGVLSFFMTFLFLWPLLLGVFPAFLLFLHMKNKRVFLRSCVPLRLWRSGVAAITMASLLRGVFEIAGTDSIHTAVLFAAGLGFLAVGVICMLVIKISFPVKKMDP